MKIQAHLVRVLLGLAFLLLAGLVAAAGVESPGAAAPALPEATVSGVIRHSSSPVAGVRVIVDWQGGQGDVSTPADGSYSVSGVPLGIPVRIHVLPPVSLGLEWRHWQYAALTGDLVKDFDLLSGYRIEGRLFQPDGATPYLGQAPALNPIGATLPQGEYLEPGAGPGRLDTMVAPGFYTIYYERWRMPEYYTPPTILDLRAGAAVSLSLTLRDRPVPIPSQPPVAGLIAVSPPDAEGYAAVTGAPGALPPLVAVMVLNLHAGSVAVTASDANGAFSTTLYAPPGSSLYIKYDPVGDRLVETWSWAQETDKETAMMVQNLPGTILTVGEPPAGGDGWQDFSTVGRFGWWAGWWLSGTLQTPVHPAAETPASVRLRVLPGDTITVTARVLATSPALNCSGTPTHTLMGASNLIYLFGLDGRPFNVGHWFTSFLFTPTGLPIEHEAAEQVERFEDFQFGDVACVTNHALEAHLVTTFTVPITLPEGTYQPAMMVLGNIPADSSVPSLVSWFHNNELARLPPIRVGDAADPHIPWTLLADYPTNGLRGLQAHQDDGTYAMPNRVRTNPELIVIPRLDERTGEPIRYQLEPGSFWLSGTDRRPPNPPVLPLDLPSGELVIEIVKPGGAVDTLGPAPILQSSVRTPSLVDGSDLDEGTGYIGDMFHLATLDDAFGYVFDQYGLYTIWVYGTVNDRYGDSYPIEGTYEVVVARVLDLDPAQLPTTPYQVGDTFAPGLHLFPPLPAHVEVHLTHLPFSDPAQAISYTVAGQANRFGVFQPPPGPRFSFELPGEFRVDLQAWFEAPDGTLWAGSTTWGNVVESPGVPFEVHGRRGMDYKSPTVDPTMPDWFANATLPASLVGIENYYPYFSGDVLWASELEAPQGGDSLHTILTIKDLTGPSEQVYQILRDHYPRAHNIPRWPPTDPTPATLEGRFDVGEAPLFITTRSGIDPVVDPADIDLMAYWYGSSERPDVHVREIISEDGMGTAYWRYQDTYGYQISEPADGDQPGDIKWNFGGVVFRVLSETNPINLYGIYGSFWVLLPHDDPIGSRVTPPFQFAAGGMNGGPLMTLLGEEIDMLFLPKGVRPGDVLQLGDLISFSGHVGPALDSRVAVTITAPSGAQHTRAWHANKIGWLYDPTFDFPAEEAGRWTVDVSVLHDRPYLPTGITPASHNSGTVLGTSGRYEFYVVAPDAPRLLLSEPPSGFITWPAGQVEPIHLRGVAPWGTTAIHYTIHDKGVVMGQGTIIPRPSGAFTLTYDPVALQADFSMLSLTAHEGRWEGLSDEVTISLLALGGERPRATTVTLIGEEVFTFNDVAGEPSHVLLPLVRH